MGATKKRRQTKHRGNAAGMVEARGRTGAGRVSGGGAAQPQRGPREPKPPSWSTSLLKALIPVAILIPILLLFQKDTSPGAIVTLLAFAYVMYVPLSYMSDRWVYNRFQKKRG